MLLYSNPSEISEGLCFTISLNDNNSITCRFDIHKHLYRVELNGDMQSHIAEVVNISNTDNFALLPKTIANQLEPITLAKFLSWEAKETQQLSVSHLKNNEIALIYQNNTPLIIGKSEHMLTYLANIASNSSNKDCITTLLADNIIHICVIKESKILLLNQFAISHADEAQYYIMLMLQEHNLDAETTALNIYGDYDEQGSLAEKCKLYIRNINYHLHPKIKDHRYSGLIELLNKTL